MVLSAAMDAHSRRTAALTAIQAVVDGARAQDMETDIVDFKEEKDTFDPAARARVAISPTHEPAAKALAAEAACLANSDSGGILVVGVDDKAAGGPAFVGTHLDTTWLRGRIHALTQPNMAIDVIEEQTVAGSRIYLINVAPALEEVRSGGKLRARIGTDCEELDGDRAREFLEKRRNYDWTAEPSGTRFSAIDPSALASARRHYEGEHGLAPVGDLALVRRLDVVLDDRDDPELNRAGALLLCAYEQMNEQLDVLVTDVEGKPSKERLNLKAPLLTAFDEAWALLRRTFAAESEVVDAQRREVRAIPTAALREALINAIMHRDYRLPRSSIVATITGNPASALKVRSPGGFPVGVRADRLLATASRPRNPALANTLRTLGLAEREGVGIDTMFRVMLRDGHPEPEIVEDSGDVICRLSGGRQDRDVRAFFDAIQEQDTQLGDDVRAYIAITELLRSTPLRPHDLVEIAQCTHLEAVEVLERLTDAGALERLLKGGQSFRLTADSRARLGRRIAYARPTSIDAHWALIRAFLDTHEDIGRDEAATLLTVKPQRATQILSELYNKHGRLEPIAKARGRGVRYRAAG